MRKPKKLTALLLALTLLFACAACGSGNSTTDSGKTISGTLPEIKHVVGSNRCAIGFVLDERLGRIVVCSVIDNLVKGAGGQAIQNMNLMFNLKETAGLPMAGMYL